MWTTAQFLILYHEANFARFWELVIQTIAKYNVILLYVDEML